MSSGKKILEITPKVMDFIRGEMRQQASKLLTVPQFRVLIQINKNPSMSQKEVAEWMGITAPTLTRMIDTLSERRLLKRTTDSHDRRHTSLSITSLGKKQVDRYRKGVQARFDQKIETLTESEQHDLQLGLEVLHKLFAQARISSS